MNGAGCMSSRYGYEMCVCPPGYHGKHCEQGGCVLVGVYSNNHHGNSLVSSSM